MTVADNQRASSELFVSAIWAVSALIGVVVVFLASQGPEICALAAYDGLANRFVSDRLSTAFIGLAALCAVASAATVIVAKAPRRNWAIVWLSGAVALVLVGILAYLFAS